MGNLINIKFDSVDPGRQLAIFASDFSVGRNRRDENCGDKNKSATDLSIFGDRRRSAIGGGMIIALQVEGAGRD